MKIEVIERSSVLSHVASGEISLKTAAETLGLSERQTQRIWQRYCTEGVGGLRHRNSGRPSNRAIPNSVRQQVLKLYRNQYTELGPTEFANELSRIGISVNHETLRRWLISHDLWHANRRTTEASPYNEGEHGFGATVALVSCRGRWLGEGSSLCWLNVLSDETTGTLMCTVDENSPRERAATLVWEWIEVHGIPASITCGKSLLLRRESDLTIEEQLNGESPETLFAKILDRLGVQARPLGTASESRRLGNTQELFRSIRSELAIAGVNTAEEANTLLRGKYGRWINRRFASDWSAEDNYHVPIEDGTQLRDVLLSVTTPPSDGPAPAYSGTEAYHSSVAG